MCWLGASYQTAYPVSSQHWTHPHSNDVITPSFCGEMLHFHADCSSSLTSPWICRLHRLFTDLILTLSPFLVQTSMVRTTSPEDFFNSSWRHQSTFLNQSNEFLSGRPTNTAYRKYCSSLLLHNNKILAAPREYHGMYIHIGEESYFKMGERFATSLPLREWGWKPFQLYALSLPNVRCTLTLFPPIHGNCLTTAEEGRCNFLPANRDLRGFR